MGSRQLCLTPPGPLGNAVYFAGVLISKAAPKRDLGPGVELPGTVLAPLQLQLWVANGLQVKMGRSLVQQRLTAF